MQSKSLLSSHRPRTWWMIMSMTHNNRQIQPSRNVSTTVSVGATTTTMRVDTRENTFTRRSDPQYGPTPSWESHTKTRFLQLGLHQTKERAFSSTAYMTRQYDREDRTEEKEYVNPFEDPDEVEKGENDDDEMLYSPKQRLDGEIGPGSKVMLEVLYFGPLGASADVIANGHKPENVIPFEQPPLGKALIVQKDIDRIIEERNDAPVIIGEVLKAVVLRVHDTTMDGFKKYEVTLRLENKESRMEAIVQNVQQALFQSPRGELLIGTKSLPEEIDRIFPGLTKSKFDKVVKLLLARGIIQQPGSYNTLLADNAREKAREYQSDDEDDSNIYDDEEDEKYKRLLTYDRFGDEEFEGEDEYDDMDFEKDMEYWEGGKKDDEETK